jgi:N-acetylglucosaminyl-diphospho-decaprenol L-rhamnosyltransferase
MLPEDKLVSIVTVLYNSASVIEAFAATTPAEAELIVVDNASTDDGASRARRVRPDLTLVRSDTNLGFGGGCNLGWRRSTRPYVAFVNPDVLLEPDTLSILAHQLEEEQHAIVGPALLDAHGEVRAPNREQSALVDFANLFPSAGRWTKRLGWDGRVRADDPVREHGGPVAFVEGACFLVRKADLEAIGGFDTDFFLYCEEQSLALRLKRRGGRSYYQPSATARHSGAHSTEFVAPMALSQYFRSRVLLYRKRDGAVRGGLAAMLLLCGAICQLATAFGNRLARRDSANTPPLALATLRGIISGAFAPIRFDG